MLSMKKFAKCSAATITSASGWLAASASPRPRNSAWKASRNVGSARCARPVTPGAWLHAAAKTRPYAGDSLIGRRRHRVDTGAHRAMATHAFAHRFDVLGPGHAEERGEVHQQ